MENAIGDIVILADNENFSTDALERGVDICCQGSDIVCGCADVRKNTCYRIGSFIFRKIFGHIVKYEIPQTIPVSESSAVGQSMPSWKLSISITCSLTASSAQGTPPIL